MLDFFYVEFYIIHYKKGNFSSPTQNFEQYDFLFVSKKTFHRIRGLRMTESLDFEKKGLKGLTSSLFPFFRVFDPVDDEWGAK